MKILSLRLHRNRLIFVANDNIRRLRFSNRPSRLRQNELKGSVPLQSIVAKREYSRSLLAMRFHPEMCLRICDT